MANIKKPALIFFQEIKPDDVDKHSKQSSTAGTGGGARDLRISPASAFTKILNPMFPNVSSIPVQSSNRIGAANIYWFDVNGGVKSAQVELLPPLTKKGTVAKRSWEIRIGKFYLIESWAVDKSEYQVARQSNIKWFYLLVMDTDAIVWARLLKEENLPNENKAVREYVQKRIRETSSAHAVRGSMDFQSKEEYP